MQWPISGNGKTIRPEMPGQVPAVTKDLIPDKRGNAGNKEKLQDYAVVQYMRMFER